MNIVTKNPVQHVETRSKSNYRAIIITPAQTLAILKSLALTASFRAGADLRRDRAALVGDSGAQMDATYYGERDE